MHSQLQEQQLEKLKYMRRFHLDEQSAILEKLHHQLVDANFDGEASVLSSEKIQEIVRRKVSPVSKPREWIKPSSPTPFQLKTHKLCLFDQYVGHHFPSTLLFYQDLDLSSTLVDIDHIVSERLQLLRQSLSEVLTLYYPLAGKIKDDISVDCNDEGIYFVEARAKIPLNQFLNQPNRSFIGLAICISLSHKVCDETTTSSFMRTWSAIARKNIEETICPDCDAASLFPPSDEFLSELTFAAQVIPFVKTGRVATRRFVFEATAIANLKAKATSLSLQNPTRVEAVSALLSKCIIRVMNKRSGIHKPTLLKHIVNLRRRSKPPISDHCMGNLVWHVNALCTEKEADLDGLATKFREAIKIVNDDFVKSLQGDEGFVNFRKVVQDVLEASSKAEDIITFTSWCNTGLNNIDFGWGKPVWVSFFQDELPPAFMNLIMLMDTRLGVGIDALVLLPEEDMALLEHDEELLAFSKLDPSPLG
ncbi:vinorine synthase-like [Melia azedarach]|uniref:Vinorine synthase-like n=1 Tax=Melia azedarach TaxID=155640 RepID=A0ACC1XWK8_MELAZ|nr:vinorine synthase-like [Melia azedarach]